MPDLFLYNLQTNNDLHTNKLFKKSKGRLIFCDTCKLYKLVQTLKADLKIKNSKNIILAFTFNIVYLLIFKCKYQ